MEHADTAQLAAVGGALGAPLVLLARGRWTLIAGLVLLVAAEVGLALSLGNASLDKLSSVPDADPSPGIDPLGASLDDLSAGGR